MKFKYNTDIAVTRKMRISEMKEGILYRVVPFASAYGEDPEPGFTRWVGGIIISRVFPGGDIGRMTYDSDPYMTAWYLPDPRVYVPEYFEVTDEIPIQY